ncbi:MAG: hypothetical protein D6707_07985, partial [Bacteroidetes bacterium]
AYERFKSLAPPKLQDKYRVDYAIQQCQNGKKLLKNISDLIVIEKKTLNRGDFFRSYDLSDIGGKLIITPDEFKLAQDKKKKETSIMYFNPKSDTIFFASYGDKGKNGKDIYFVVKLPNGEWGKPQNIGAPINTPLNEDFAFYHRKTKTLYFSSEGHNSMGGYDIFKSVYDPYTKSWSNPINLDYAINTPDDDFLYITDAQEKTAVFASNRATPYSEVSVYKINVNRVPVHETIIKGEFLSEATKSAKITVKNSATGKTVGIYNTNPVSGKYIISLPKSGRYEFIVETDKSPVAYTGIVELPKMKEVKPLKQEIELTVQNGVERLIIRNLFDEELPEEEMLYTADLLKQKANLDVNVDEFQELLNEPSSETAQAEEISNEDIVKMAYADAEEIENEYKELQKKADLAYKVAQEKGNEAQERNKEAQELLALAEEAQGAEKNELLSEAEKKQNEANKLAKQALLATELAKDIEQKAKAKKAESEQAFEYALQIDNAVNSQSEAELAEAMEKIQELVNAEKTTDEELYASILGEYNKRKNVSDSEIKKAEKLREERVELEQELEEIKGRANIIKDKTEKQELLRQAEEIEQELAELTEKEKQAFEKAAELQKKTDELKEEAQLAQAVISELQSSDIESFEGISDEDKLTLESNLTELENIAQSESNITFEENLPQSEKSDSEEQLVTEEPVSQENLTSAEKSHEESLTEEELASEKQITSEEIAEETSDQTTETSGNATSAQTPEDIEDYYSAKIQEAQQSNNSEQQLELYQEWEQTIENAINEKQNLIAQTSDDNTKQQLQSEIELLNNQLENIRQHKSQIEQPSLAEAIENTANNTEETNIENAAEESTSVSETTEITANEE